MKRLFLTLVLCLMTLPSLAVEPSEILDDPVLEARARDISSGLRCLVCQNQSIDGSDAELAADLRVLVRDRLLKGDSDEQVRDYVVARYGEFVLLQPVFGFHTLVLWLAAPLILVVGLLGIFLVLRKKQVVVADTKLTRDEQAMLAALAQGDDDGRDKGHI